MAVLRGMRHIAIVVSDLERSAAFYQRALGMVPFGSPKHAGTVMPLVSPGLRDQVTLMAESSQGETGRQLGKPGEMGGIDHFGFVLGPGTDLDAFRSRMEGAGARFVERVDVAKNVPSVFFTDPDGYLLQFTRFPRLTRLYIGYLRLRQRFAPA